MILSHSLARLERIRSNNPPPLPVGGIRGDFAVLIGWVSLAALTEKDPGARPGGV
jgi:hypothetical protein